MTSLMRAILAAVCLLMGSMLVTAQAALPVMGDGQRMPTLAPMLERITPAVVNISTRSEIQIRENPLLSDPFFRRFFELPEQRPRTRQSQSLGSGVVIDAKRGLVITNTHVIDKADEITVTLQDGRAITAKLVGSDPETDVAVVQIKADQLTAIDLGNSDQLRVGDFVVAIGSPFGLSQTVTSGIVSALGRSGLGIEGYEDFIQTDASINPGNSGGALVNLRGELIGLNTAIIAPGGGNVGIGFAIPANMVQQLTDQLIEHGRVQRGQLGVTTQDLTPDLAQAFGSETARGALIADIVPGSAADRAGLNEGDVVVEANGRAVNDSDDLRNIIGLVRVGQEVKLQIMRGSKQHTIHARIEKPQLDTLSGKKLHPYLEGANFSGLDDLQRHRLGHGGVLVTEVDPRSPARQTGLRKNDIIIGMNRQRVADIQSLTVAAKKSRNGVLLNIQRGNRTLYLALH